MCGVPIKASHVTTTACLRERTITCPVPLASGSRVGAVPELLCGAEGRGASVHPGPAQSGRWAGSATGETHYHLIVPSHSG